MLEWCFFLRLRGLLKAKSNGYIHLSCQICEFARPAVCYAISNAVYIEAMLFEIHSLALVLPQL